jgi:hypothetical protein
MQLSSAAQSLVDLFGHIVIINLPERTDRRRAIDAELRKVGLSLDLPAVELFSGIRPATAAGFPSIGAHGAFRSHLGVMERLLDRGWTRALVLEDDMAFAPGALQRLPRLLVALARRDWAMLYGHAGDPSHSAGTPDADGLIRLSPDLDMIQLHFLGLTREAAQVAVPELQAMLARPEGHVDGGPMHVDGALNWVRRRNPALVALAIVPALAIQRASRSDVAEPRWFDRLPLLRNLATLLRRLI